MGEGGDEEGEVGWSPLRPVAHSPLLFLSLPFPHSFFRYPSGTTNVCVSNCAGENNIEGIARTTQ